MRKNVSFVCLALLLAGLALVTGGGAEAHTATHEFSIGDAQAPEGTGVGTGNVSMTISVTETIVDGEELKVDWATSAIGATAMPSSDATVEFPEDYQVKDGTATFAASDTQQTIDIPVLQDNIGEPMETFRVNLFNARSTCTGVCQISGGSSVAIDDGQGVFTINNDDLKFSIDDVTRQEGADAPSPTTAFTFTVTRTDASVQATSVEFDTADGTTNPANAGNDYVANSGTLNFPASADPTLDTTATQTVVVEVNDDTMDEINETFRVVLSNAPAGATITDATGVGTIEDDDPAPNPPANIDDTGATASEGDAIPFTISLTATPGIGQSATVDYSTSPPGGTATSGTDYPVQSGTATFGPGEDEFPITINTTEDAIDEPDQTLTVTLSKPVGCCTGGYDYDIGDGTGQGTITDDDAASGLLTIDDVSVAEGNFATSTATASFTVTKSNTEQPVTVDYATANDTATAGSDYVADNGTVNFAAGDTTKTIEIDVMGDVVDEPDETFFVNLSNATLATISDPQGEGTITDDDDGAAQSTHDFNGDGFADEAFGVPGENFGGKADPGQVNVIYGTASGLSASASVPDQAWHLNVADIDGTAASNDRFGSALAYGDFNGDGFDDLAVGVPGSASGAGAVSVLFGSAGGLTTTDQFLTQGTADVEGDPEAGDAFGAALAAGDLNADGFMDLIVGAPGEGVGGSGANTGVVHVLLGTAGGLTGTGSQLWHQDTTGIGEVGETGDRFGAALASGDLNGDGIPDLLVGSPGEDVGALADAGLVHVLYAGTAGNAGLTSTGSQTWDQGTTDVEGEPETGDAFGSAVAIGDLDEDGFGDAAIGAPREDVASSADAGAVNVLFGSDAGLAATGDVIIDQNTAGIAANNEADDLFGASLHVADFDGDATSDLAIGAPGEAIGSRKGAGALTVLFGGATWPATSGNQLLHQNTDGIGGASKAGDAFAASLGSGDFNNDGKDDLVVGVPFKDFSRKANAGVALVINGGASGLTTTDKTWHQDVSGVAGAAEKNDFFGSFVG